MCVAAAIIGSACGIASWLACAQIQNGAINITTTGLNPPLLTGNIFSVGISAILVVAISLIFPQAAFDWEVYKEKITTSEDTVRTSLLSHLDCLPFSIQGNQADVHGCKVVVAINLKALEWEI